MEQEYPEKVLAIYEAVGRLMAEGREPNDLKVSDITKAAGIGKGTAYEYFSSKEEIINRAVCYQMQTMLERAMNLLKNLTTLEAQLTQMIEWAEYSVANHMISNFFKLQIKDADNQADMENRAGELAACRDRFFEKLADIMLETGNLDGSISKPEDRTYARAVIIAAVMLMIEMSISRTKGGSCKEMETQRILDYTMRVITKSLN
jgi:AcrR family transcriptional regulator